MFNKDTAESLIAAGEFEYGAEISNEKLAAMFGETYHSLEDWEHLHPGLTFDGIESFLNKRTFMMLDISSKLREHLVACGRYLKGDSASDGYRILMPRENQHQANSMTDIAQKKYTRAILLMQMTPVRPEADHDQSVVRARLKADKIARDKNKL